MIANKKIYLMVLSILISLSISSSLAAYYVPDPKIIVQYNATVTDIIPPPFVSPAESFTVSLTAGATISLTADPTTTTTPDPTITTTPDPTITTTPDPTITTTPDPTITTTPDPTITTTPDPTTTTTPDPTITTTPDPTITTTPDPTITTTPDPTTTTTPDPTITTTPDPTTTTTPDPTTTTTPDPTTTTTPDPTDTSSPSPDPTRSSSSGGSSSGGGGGGIVSGENISNIDLIEKHDLPIYKDITTSYRFTNEKNPILFVNVTGNVTSDIITTSVEILKNQSTFVMSAQTGLVYRYANIWVGLSGFAAPGNIKEGTIKFRVENSWINDNNLLSTEIKLQRWDGSKWFILETSEKSNDSSFTYYEASTRTFSSFAITALKEEPTLMEVLLPEKTSVQKEEKVLAKNPGNKPKGKSGFLMNWFLISGIFIVIGLIVEVYLSVRKKKNNRQFST